MTSIGLCSTFDIIIYEQIGIIYSVYSKFSGGKDLSNDTQIRMIISMEPEIRSTNHKFVWKTPRKISCDYTWLLYGNNCPSQRSFLRTFWTGSKPSRRKALRCRSLSHSKFWFLHMAEQKCGASGKKGMLSCCTCLFE